MTLLTFRALLQSAQNKMNAYALSLCIGNSVLFRTGDVGLPSFPSQPPTSRHLYPGPSSCLPPASLLSLLTLFQDTPVVHTEEDIGRSRTAKDLAKDRALNACAMLLIVNSPHLQVALPEPSLALLSYVVPMLGLARNLPAIVGLLRSFALYIAAFVAEYNLGLLTSGLAGHLRRGAEQGGRFVAHHSHQCRGPVERLGLQAAGAQPRVPRRLL